jgi:hypothetical protein
MCFASIQKIASQTIRTSHIGYFYVLLRQNAMPNQNFYRFYRFYKVRNALSALIPERVENLCSVALAHLQIQRIQARRLHSH